jgi:6-phosphofructokinase 1
MNAALRATVRAAYHHKRKVIGVESGFQGMIENRFQELFPRSMANLIQRGGTVLKTGRSTSFMKPEGRAIAAQNLKSQNIDGLVCIGGNGSLAGCHELFKEHGIPYVAIPGTIDNDIFGTDNTIGFDTALNTALDAIDRVRDTAASHDRLFIVEVMGRDSGQIALHVGLAGGAEEIFVPEKPQQLDLAIDKILKSTKGGKLSSILVTAEGQKPGRAYDLAEALRKKAGLEAKVCILGHVQRGGSPTAADRILASRLGAAAVDYLIHGYQDVLVGIENGSIVLVNSESCLQKSKPIDVGLLELARILSN